MFDLSQLSRRDRTALIVGGIVVLITIVVFGLVLPYQGAMSRLDSRIETRQKQVREVDALQQEYRVLQQQLAEAQNRLAKSRGFSLFSFIESQTTQVATKENLVYMRPQQTAARDGRQEESVEIKLEKLSLDQLVRFLFSVESADAYLQVKNLRVRTRFDDPSLLDATMTISSFGGSA
jgi:general secretion pathway protein M